MKKQILLALLFGATLVAEDPVRKDGFFDKDFVVPKSAASATPSPTASPSNKADFFDGKTTDEFGEKIVALGILIDIYDKKHFNKVLENYHNIVFQNHLYPAPIYAYGINDQVYSNPLIIQLITLGGLFTNVYVLPREYAVESSPVWIITLEKGQVLIEGLLNIDKYVQKGMFYEKMIPDYQQKKELEQKPAAF